MKKWQFWLGVLISIVFIWLSLRGLRLDEFWGSVQKANYIWLIPGIGVYFIGVWVRAWRWHYLLKPIKEIPTKTMFPITTIGYMGNNIYPARAGEVLRAVILKRKEGVPVSASLATIIVERIFDGVVMLAFVFLNLPELAKLTSASGFVGNIQQAAVVGTGVFLGALGVFLLAAMFPQVTSKNGLWVIERITPKRLHIKIINIMNKFLDGLASLRSPFNVLMVFFTSVIIWLLETGKYWFVMHAFNFNVSFFALMLMNGCQSRHNHPIRAGLSRHIRCAGYCSPYCLWSRSSHCGRVYAHLACCIVAPYHLTRCILHGARRVEVERFFEGRN